MWYSTTKATMLMSGALLLVLSAPVAALVPVTTNAGQAAQAPNRQVKNGVSLTLRGDVPRDTTFTYEYSLNGGEYRSISLCGSGTSWACYGGRRYPGTLYIEYLTVPAGSRLAYRFVLTSSSGRRDVIERDQVTIDKGIGMDAEYRFPPDDLPDFVNLTFVLTVNGNAPERQAILGHYDYAPQTGSSPLPVYLCSEKYAERECEGGGTKYSVARKVLRGRTLRYQFVRFGQTPGDAEPFQGGGLTPWEDETVRATYNFPSDTDVQQGGKDSHLPAGLPQTGGGGMHRTAR